MIYQTRIMKPPRHVQTGNFLRTIGNVGIFRGLQNAILRYSRLQICATPLLLLFCLLTLTASAAADKIVAPITLRNFKLIGDLSGGHATFTLTAIAHVENSKGGSLDLLTGPVALTELGAH